MTEENTGFPDTTVDDADESREKNATAHKNVRDAIDSATDYIRTHPWTSILGAALAGGILTALFYDKSKSIGSCKLGSLRNWLERGYAGGCSKLASKKQIASSAIPTDLAAFLDHLKAKLHLPQ